MPSFPTFDLPTIDFSKIELPFELPFDLPTFDLPTIDFSKIELPTIDFSGVDLPNVDLPSADQVIAFFRDAAFAGTGLVALTAERVAELQQQLVEVLKAQIERVRATV